MRLWPEAPAITAQFAEARQYAMVRKGTKRRPAPEQDKMIVEALRGVGRPGQRLRAHRASCATRRRLAPQTVYRSLDRLIADGQAHRLELLNAFVACRHPEPRGRGRVRHLRRLRHRHRVRRAGGGRASRRAGRSKAKFAVEQMTLELRGRCRACTGASSGGGALAPEFAGRLRRRPFTVSQRRLRVRWSLRAHACGAVPSQGHAASYIEARLPCNGTCARIGARGAHELVR